MFLFTLFLTIGLSSGFEDKTVVQYCIDNGFSTLAQLLTTAGLVGPLSSSGPFTVFAPTDDAFSKVDNATLQGLLANPAIISAVLQYHVVPEFVLVPMISRPINKTTLEGQDLTIVASGGTLLLNNVSTVDPDRTKHDIIVNNGVIQPIDTVLLPPVMASFDIIQILLKDDARFQDLFLALLLADLVTILESGDYTVFAPTDKAFAVYQDNLLDPSSPSAKLIYQEVLKYHVVPGGRKASQLSDGQKLATVHGTTVSISVSPGGVKVNNATVLEADIIATNGVIHAIDSLLIPSDINQIAQGRK